MRLFGMDFYEGSLEQAVEDVISWIVTGDDFKVVVTPNLQHLRMISELEYLEPDFLARYQSDKNWHFADGKPLVLASQLRGGSIERISGSDFLPAFLSKTNNKQSMLNRPVRVAVLGANEELMLAFTSHCESQYPSIEVCISLAAPMNFKPEGLEAEAIAYIIRQAQPDILLCGLGFLKQEKFLFKYGEYTGAKVGVAIGAAIEFLVSKKKRSPVWLQNLGGEWLFRALTDHRLIPRYGKDILFLPKFVAQLIK